MVKWVAEFGIETGKKGRERGEGRGGEEGGVGREEKRRIGGEMGLEYVVRWN